MSINPQRIKTVKSVARKSGPVIYWMSRDQRIHDNWGLIHAIYIADKMNKELRIVFCLTDNFHEAGLRHYDFMLRGLAKCSKEAGKNNIPFDLVQGDPEYILPLWLEKNNVCHVITDFDPLRIKRSWQDKIIKNSDVEFHIADAHNIVPCWVTSDKQEYAARTIRTKIHKKLDEFLEPFPEIKPLDQECKSSDLNIDILLKDLSLNNSISPVDWIRPGWDEALNMLDHFLEHGLKDYQEKRNDPNADVLSNLSPYLHFGQICSQTVALRLKQNKSISVEDADSFLEELIVRKELSDNYCWFNNNYDNFDGLPDWGKKTLDKHRSDPREYMYSRDEFENGQTHDPLWNACQQEMVITGKMHGYMRMYWAKKILEWTASPGQAIEFAVYLNDKYELDGRDPNGYTGIMWSMGGLHDRPWKERHVFGTVRYMNYKGCKRKFNVDQYIQKWTASRR